MESSLWPPLLLLTALLTALYWYFTRNFSYWQHKGIPYIKPIPFFGNVKDLFFLRFSSGGFLMDIYNKMPGRPYVGFYIFNRPALVIRDPNLIKKVLVKDFHAFADRFTDSDIHSDPLGSKNLFCIKGQAWKYLRMKLAPTFTSGRMKQMFPLVAECDSQMVKYLDRENDREMGKTVDIKEIAAKCTTDVISTCAFGITSNSLSNPDAEFREFGKKTFEYNNSRAMEVIAFFFIPWFVKIARFSFFQKQTCDFLRKVFWDTIELRERNRVKRNDLVDLLIELKNKGNIEYDVKDETEMDKLEHDENVSKAFDFSGDDLVAQAAIFFVAGFETSASTISFALYELALHPDMQTRLRAEITDALMETGGAVTYDMVFSMKYLDMVISETLRKYPTLPFLDRVAVKDYHVPETGLTIEKGTPVYIAVHGLHLDPRYFPNPQKFDPERFSSEEKRTRTPFTYMPFGEGPHNCIGMRFGLMSAKTGVVHILRDYVVEPSEQTPIPLRLNTRGIVITTVGGVPLRFQKSPVV